MNMINNKKSNLNFFILFIIKLLSVKVVANNDIDISVERVSGEIKIVSSQDLSLLEEDITIELFTSLNNVEANIAVSENSSAVQNTIEDHLSSDDICLFLENSTIVNWIKDKPFYYQQFDFTATPFLENDLFFWVASNGKGDLLSPASKRCRWNPVLNDNNNWVFRAQALEGLTHIYAATKVTIDGQQLRMIYSKSDQAQLHLYSMGKVLYADQELFSRVDHAVLLDLPEGPQRIVVGFTGNTLGQFVDLQRFAIITPVDQSVEVISGNEVDLINPLQQERVLEASDLADAFYDEIEEIHEWNELREEIELLKKSLKVIDETDDDSDELETLDSDQCR